MSIFVGNLPFRAEQNDVEELFAPFGGVTTCSLPLERETGRKRGFAFVELADEATEARAIEALQGAELMGRPLRINKAEPRSSGGPRRSGGGGYGAAGGGGYGGSGGGYAGGGGTGGGGRSSGASSWEDRSYGGASDGFGEGRSRRRRSSGDTAGGSSWGASDGGSDGYGGAQD